MRQTAGSMLAVFALAVPVLAQTEARETKAKVDTEKLWLIEVTGIGG